MRGRCVGFIAQPEWMTIELVLVHPDPEHNTGGQTGERRCKIGRFGYLSGTHGLERMPQAYH